MKEVQAKLPPMATLGQGIWFMFHWMALKTETHSDRERLLLMLREWSISGPCQTCGREFSQILDNTAQRMSQICDARTLFEYTVYCHNLVNSRLHKPNIDIDTAYSLYTDLHCDNDLCVGQDHTNSEQSKLRNYNVINNKRRVTAAEYRGVDENGLPVSSRAAKKFYPDTLNDERWHQCAPYAG